MEEQIFHLSLWKNNPVCLTFLVFLETCGLKDFRGLLLTVVRLLLFSFWQLLPYSHYLNIAFLNLRGHFDFEVSTGETCIIASI